MNLLKRFALFALSTCLMSRYSEGKAGGQCGAEFVKALYQACAVARRAFDPMGMEEEQQLQGVSQDMMKRGNGGRFGSSGAGGMFRRMFDLEEFLPYTDSHGSDMAREQMDDSPAYANQYFPASKLKNYASGVPTSMKGYVHRLGQDGGSRQQRDAALDSAAVHYINQMAQRGNTASNLLADYCCKYGCQWRTLVDLCK